MFVLMFIWVIFTLIPKVVSPFFNFDTVKFYFEVNFVQVYQHREAIEKQISYEVLVFLVWAK